MSDDNVVILDVATTLDLPVERVLEGAKEPLEEGTVFIVGLDSDGGLYCASNISKVDRLLWMLEKAKQELLR